MLRFIHEPFMMNVIMLNVVMLSVVAPLQCAIEEAKNKGQYLHFDERRIKTAGQNAFAIFRYCKQQN
jgi:hypothetical protein